MTLVETSLLNALAVSTRILAAIGINKILAVYIGPAGYAVVGQFANALTLISSIAGSSIGSGVTKYTAEYGDAPDRQRALWRSAFRFILVATLLVSIAVVVFSEPLAAWLLGNASFRSVFLWLALALPLLTFNALLLAIMNGKKDVRRYVAQNIASSLFGAVAAAALVVPFGLEGALAAVVVSQSAIVLVTLWLCRKADWLVSGSFVGFVRSDDVRKLSGFAVMVLTSAAVAPIGQILIRNHLIDTFGLEAAGEWQAVFKMSEIYLQLFTATLGIYLLPRVAEIRDGRTLWRELVKVERFILPLAVLAAATLYVLREWVTITLFTERFLGMIGLFRWQLVGDVLKVGGLIFGYVMVGRAMVRWYVVTEIFFSIAWVALTLALTPSLGREGAPAAFAVTYGMYWLFMIVLVRREMRRMR